IPKMIEIFSKLFLKKFISNLRPKLRIIQGRLKKIISKKRIQLFKTKKSKNNEENKLIKIRAAPNSRIKLNFLALILIMIN
ncbi:MAG: hypothetical protein ACFE78_13625, partial [Candidatus Hodarchaeota archaeon]